VKSRSRQRDDFPKNGPTSFHRDMAMGNLTTGLVIYQPRLRQNGTYDASAWFIIYRQQNAWTLVYVMSNI
jgi:hypothetical protein